MPRVSITSLVFVAALAACGPAVEAPTLAPSKPGVLQRAIAALPGTPPLPSMEWDGRANSDEWTAATLAALDREGAVLMSQVPKDVLKYCPSYQSQSHENRRAFWAGLLSAVARHESGWNPLAKGRGGDKLGLMQISEETARNFNCGGSMLSAEANMACAVRILAKQVGRDNEVAGSEGGWRGIARDWVALRNQSKRKSIASWTSKQSYCTK